MLAAAVLVVVVPWIWSAALDDAAELSGNIIGRADELAGIVLALKRNRDRDEGHLDAHGRKRRSVVKWDHDLSLSLLPFSL